MAEKSKKEIVVIGQADAGQIDGWKKKYPGGVFALNVQDEEGNTHVTYMRKPDRKAISAAAVYAETDPLRTGETLFNTLRLGGSAKVIEDDELFISVSTKVSNLFKIKEVEIKKL